MAGFVALERYVRCARRAHRVPSGRPAEAAARRLARAVQGVFQRYRVPVAHSRDGLYVRTLDLLYFGVTGREGDVWHLLPVDRASARGREAGRLNSGPSPAGRTGFPTDCAPKRRACGMK